MLEETEVFDYGPVDEVTVDMTGYMFSKPSHTLAIWDDGEMKVSLDFKTGLVESNISEDQQIYVLVKVFKEIARQYGFVPQDGKEPA